RELAGPGIALGVDEVGRGAIAGPLTVCAVALPSEPVIWGLNDSKQLTPQKREALAARIAEVALAIGIAHIEPASIDAVGMGSAIRMGMSQAIENAGIEPDAVLIDGNPVHVHPREKTLVKGDARVACIAAASIVAKVTRDAMMCAYAEDYPDYHLDACKGYGSAEHIEAVRALGCSPIHRVSFCGNFLETPRLF
ncbi:MAG: ribonuclease HII, partial [Atopobiaceae bacterium]|nr:ribonuclease HII [Atopobiaceae bacterium]